ncbi:hypothetical protein COU60_02685 [Candidatus Pacearchaeota archaeon CG10_big_fil_rev_8_21_14_0_10_34_76]|nr:MAG: hypothetical protein COU60_02685 [Candidatus Pacearchaeota archaeon CG10_big_fil_rev_8_21_14_0_10_34_76]
MNKWIMSTGLLFAVLVVGVILLADQSVAQLDPDSCDPFVVANDTFNDCVDNGGTCSGCFTECVNKCEAKQTACGWSNSTTLNGCIQGCFALAMECILEA